MTPPTHSPTPWSIAHCGSDGLWVIDANKQRVLSLHGLADDESRLIVACVNACREIPPAELEGRVFKSYSRYAHGDLIEYWLLEDPDHAS